MNNTTSAVDNFPMIAKLLGYLGVIPFVVLALSVASGFDSGFLSGIDKTVLLLGYAAIIISFIGAVHWGIALNSATENQTKLFSYSVLPALVAWAWLFFPAPIALAGMALTVLSLYFVDRQLLRGLVPAAYLKMRLHLTVVVSLSLLVASFGR